MTRSFPAQWQLLALLLLVTVLPACSWFEDKDEEEPEPAPLVDFDAEVRLDRAWSASIGDGQGSKFNRLQLAVDGDTLYVAESGGRVMALDRIKGRRQWSVKTGRDISGGVGVGGDLVVVGTAAGDVIALDRNTGGTRWEVAVSGEVLAPPAADAEVVVVQCFDGSVYGLDATSGKRLWQYDNPLPVLTLRGTAAPQIIDGVAYLAFANGRLVALRANTGDLLWEGRVAAAKGQSEIDRVVDVDGNPHVVGNAIFAISYQGRLSGFDLRSGRPLWFHDASSTVGLDDGFGNIYYASSDGSVVALDINSGTLRWQQDGLSRRELSAPTTFGNYVAVGDFEGYIHLLSQVDGHFAGREKLGSDGIRAPMLQVGDFLYVYGNDGKLVAYTIRK